MVLLDAVKNEAVALKTLRIEEKFINYFYMNKVNKKNFTISIKNQAKVGILNS